MDNLPASSVSQFQRIRTEQLQLLSQQTLAATIGNIMAILVLVLVLWNVINREFLISVLLVMSIGMSLRYWVANRYLSNPTAYSISTWSTYFLASIGLMGLLWGGVALTFFSMEEPWRLMLVCMVILGLTTAAIGSLSVYMPAYFLFTMPMMIALTVQFFSNDSTVSVALGVGAITFLLACVVWSRNLNSTILESIKLRFDNLDLVAQLSLQKDQANAAKNEAENANIAKSRFLAAASHDLRQPLHAQGLFLSALEEQLTDPKSRMLVDRIKKSSHMLRDLLDSLLDISKLDAGVIKPSLRGFPLQALFDAMLEEFSPLTAKKNLCFSCVSTSVWVLSDRDMLTRVLRNLLSNAIHYTEQGRVLFGVRRHKNQIIIEVWDSGIGIHTDHIDDIFEEFHQLNNPGRDRNKGLGLGLAIVRRLAGLLKHRIHVESRLNHGSVFQVYVPLAEAQHHVPQTQKPILGDQLHAKHVLLIDDEQEIREGFSILLEQWGCVVSTASGIVEAMDIVKTSMLPDIIVADYRLQKNETGLQAVKQIQQYLNLALPIPAIIVTGDTAAQRLQEAKAGGYPLLHKPVQPAKLRTLMNTVLLNSQRDKITADN